MKKFSSFDTWLAQLVFHKNDTRELIIRKKFFLISNLIAILYLSSLSILAYSLELKNFAGYILILVACNLAQTILLLITRKWSKWFVYSAFSLYVILIFYIIISLGGLANSAGFLMGAYFFLLTAQWMKDTKLLFLVGGVFVVGVLVTGISYPYLTPDAALLGWKNNLFFVINFAWIGLLLAVALYSTIVKSENAAKSRADQLQKLDLLKSKLYANIAHEFRTPLTLIKANAEEISEQHDDETFTQTNSIIRNSDKILFLVNQMLNLSRIEQGGVAMHYSRADLVAFVSFIVSSFLGYADSRKIGLHYQPLCQQLIMDIEPEKLEESLSNLLSNAIKYTPEGGEVYVTVRKPLTQNQHTTDPPLLSSPHHHITLSHQPGFLAQPINKVEISVRDTGIGIPEDQLDKIFLRFYRVDDKRYPYQEGSGIGLTLVSEYLKLMKGSIAVTSVPGEGSEFVIALPVTQNADFLEIVPKKSNYTPVEGMSSSTLKKTDDDLNLPCLLIIEDNQEMAKYLTGILSGKYHILTAENGILGIEQAIEHVPDLILSDVMMPGKDGYQVCQELKNDIRTNHIPIVLLTARGDTQSRIIGREQGADAWLTKPFDKKELLVCLHNLFIQREILRLKFQSHFLVRKTDEKEPGLNEKFLTRIIEHLEKNYADEKYGLKNLYTDMGISRVQLYRKLVAITGQSASNFIRSFRLQKARKILLKTDKNVSEIAYEVGFSDPNYFTRVFTQEHGMTPSELRKSFVNS